MVDSVNVHIQLNEENNRIKKEIRNVIIKLTQDLHQQSHNHLTVGSPYLKVGEGRLRSSLISDIYTKENSIEGVVKAGGAHIKYMFIHEFGLFGSISIKEHLRRIKKAFGRPIPLKEVLVKSHSRTVRFKERRMLRDALKIVSKDLPEKINKAIDRGLNGQ